MQNLSPSTHTIQCDEQQWRQLHSNNKRCQRSSKAKCMQMVVSTLSIHTNDKVLEKALRKIFGLIAGTTTYKLGMWLHNYLSRWTWFYHPGSKSIIQRFGNVWRMWKRESNKGRMGSNSRFKYFTTRARIPNSVQKATIQYWSDNRIKLTKWSKCTNDHRTSSSLSILIDSLNLPLHHTDAQVAEMTPHLINGTVDIVYGGSYYPHSNIGAAA